MFDDIAGAVAGFLEETPWWAPLALQGAGTLARRQGQKQVMGRQNEFLQRERARQHGFQQQADATLAPATQRFERPAQDALQQKVQADYEARFAPGGFDGSYATPASGAPEQSQTDLAKAVADGLSRGKDYAKNLARFQSFGGTNLDNSVALGRSGQDVAQIGRASAGSLDIVPFEMEGAQSAGRRMAGASDVLNGAGSLLFLGKALAPKRKPPFTQAQLNDGTLAGGNF